MQHVTDYRRKLVTAEQAVQTVKSGDWVDYSFCLAQPVILDEHLAARKDELHDIKVRGGLLLRPLAILEQDPHGEHFTFMSWHLGGYERKLSDRGRCTYIPLLYRNMPLFYRKSLEVDVAMLSVSPMDNEGFFHFSLNNSASKAMTDKARTVIVEVNTNLPPVLCGAEHRIHISEVDYVVEGNNPPLPTLPEFIPSEADRRIASYIIEELSDNATIQLGIGSLPNAIGEIITASDLKGLGIHTEMLVDSYMQLTEAGKISNASKQVDQGKTIFTFCAGSQELYDWVRDNTGIASHPVDYVNAPHVMAQHDKLMTINSCLEVDITGQFNSESSGYRQISGTGGQLDFLTGGYLSREGKSFLCCNTTYTDKNGTVHSRIVPTFSEGSTVTTPRAQAHCLVTEYGIADIAGRSLWERTERIINVAHPDFRDQLIVNATNQKLWRRSNKIA